MKKEDCSAAAEGSQIHESIWTRASLSNLPRTKLYRDQSDRSGWVVKATTTTNPERNHPASVKCQVNRARWRAAWPTLQIVIKQPLVRLPLRPNLGPKLSPSCSETWARGPRTAKPKDPSISCFGVFRKWLADIRARDRWNCRDSNSDLGNWNFSRTRLLQSILKFWMTALQVSQMFLWSTGVVGY